MFSHLNDFELHEATVRASSHEKSATLILLSHLFEMDLRKAYQARGFHSLWEYVEKGLHYSSAQTAERVSALRLLQKLPEARAAVESGGLTLTSAAQLGSFVRREKKTEAEARELLKQCTGKSSREVARVLAPLESIPRADQVSRVSREKTRITIEVDEAFMALLARAKELGRNPTSTPQDVFARAMMEFVKKREVKKRNKMKNSVNRSESKMESIKESKIESEVKPSRAPYGTRGQECSGQGIRNTGVNPKPAQNGNSPTMSAPPVKSGESSPDAPVPDEYSTPLARHIPARIRNQVRIRADDRCEYEDQITHFRCENRTTLELHHHYAYALGGPHSEANLSLLCWAHHRETEVTPANEWPPRNLGRCVPSFETKSSSAP